jgi:hypothetical protein
VAPPRVEPERDEQDEERGDPVPTQETLVRLGPMKELGREDPMLVDARKLQVVRNGGGPQQVGSEQPRGGTR